MQLADAVAVQHYLIARLEVWIVRFLDRAREIDAADMRPGLHQPAAARQDQPVLVVERRVFDRDRDIACRKPCLVQGLDGAAHLAVGRLGQHQRTE